MAIAEEAFDAEAELRAWAEANIALFLGDCVYIQGFLVRTTSGKGCVPDGFAFDFAENQWHLVEYELLEHGVWPHIAEQVTRFVVALQNPATLREIRDRLFEHILSAGLTDRVAEQLGVASERLLQQVELFVEGVRPNLAIVIDDTNQDLTDFAQALDATTQVFRVKKFRVNGRAEYYCPDRDQPAVQTNPEPQPSSALQVYDVIDRLGGGTAASDLGRLKLYRLTDGRLVHVKASKYYEKNQGYWYGINPSVMDRLVQAGVSHVVFVMGDHGFAAVPVGKVREYLKTAGVTKNPDGSIRHYHVLISHGPKPEMYTSSEVPSIPLGEYFQAAE
jgi:hypothetical protein